jgi:anti-sigma factor (TIGR02949 family)
MNEHDQDRDNAAGCNVDPGADHELDCDDAISQLYTYLDGELDAETAAHLEAHLRQCSPCLEAYDFEAELRKVIAARCREDMPGEIRSRLLSVIDRLAAESGGNAGAPGGV